LNSIFDIDRKRACSKIRGLAKLMASGPGYEEPGSDFRNLRENEQRIAHLLAQLSKDPSRELVERRDFSEFPLLAFMFDCIQQSRTESGAFRTYRRILEVQSAVKDLVGDVAELAKEIAQQQMSVKCNIAEMQTHIDRLKSAESNHVQITEDITFLKQEIIKTKKDVLNLSDASALKTSQLDTLQMKIAGITNELGNWIEIPKDPASCYGTYSKSSRVTDDVSASSEKSESSRRRDLNELGSEVEMLIAKFEEMRIEVEKWKNCASGVPELMERLLSNFKELSDKVDELSGVSNAIDLLKENDEHIRDAFSDDLTKMMKDFAEMRDDVSGLKRWRDNFHSNEISDNHTDEMISLTQGIDGNLSPVNVSRQLEELRRGMNRIGDEMAVLENFRNSLSPGSASALRSVALYDRDIPAFSEGKKGMPSSKSLASSEKPVREHRKKHGHRLRRLKDQVNSIKNGLADLEKSSVEKYRELENTILALKEEHCSSCGRIVRRGDIELSESEAFGEATSEGEKCDALPASASKIARRHRKRHRHHYYNRLSLDIDELRDEVLRLKESNVRAFPENLDELSPSKTWDRVGIRDLSDEIDKIKHDLSTFRESDSEVFAETSCKINVLRCDVDILRGRSDRFPEEVEKLMEKTVSDVLKDVDKLRLELADFSRSRRINQGDLDYLSISFEEVETQVNFTKGHDLNLRKGFKTTLWKTV
jgi:chromosome segregation ATPase